MTAMTTTLYQLRLSHFNEKARWTLDHKRVPHVRRTFLPAFHVAAAIGLKRQQTMPILDLDGDRIGDSADIADALEKRYPDPPLYPEDPEERSRALELERYFDEELGPDIRRVFFLHMLAEVPHELRDTYTLSAGRLAKGAYDVLWPVTEIGMRRSMEVTPEAAERSTARTVAALDRIEAELGDGEYLVGDRFGIADLTAASLLFPLLRPPEFQYAYPPAAPGLEALRAELGGRPAYRWALEMWHRHRPESAAIED